MRSESAFSSLRRTSRRLEMEECGQRLFQHGEDTLPHPLEAGLSQFCAFSRRQVWKPSYLDRRSLK
jgi:hypothetical protein